jgi:hypothetical protein
MRWLKMHDHGPRARELPVDLAKLPEPQRIEGIGQSNITITTQSAEAQQWFDQGLAEPSSRTPVLRSMELLRHWIKKARAKKQ